MEVVSSEKLAKLVAERIGAETEDASWVLESAVEVIREQIGAGNEVELSHDVIAMLLAGPEGGAAAEALAATAPAPAAAPAPEPVAMAADEPPPTVIEKLPVEEALAEAPAALEEEIEKGIESALDAAGPYSILFVVPARDFFTDIIVGRLAGPKSTVTVAEGIEEAKAAISQGKPDIVILDANAEGYEDFTSYVKSDKALSLIAIVTAYPEGMDPGKVNGLRVFEDANIVEPFDVEDLVKLSESELARTIEEREWFQHEINFQFQTSEQWIEQANDTVGQLVEQSGLDEEASAAVCVAFREAVDNAARHGNRLQAKRIIDVIYLVDKEKVSITVEDEGDGFDTDAYLTRGREGNAVAAARARHQAGRVGGLGIMLMLRCVDDLEYNSVGNKLKLTKFIAA